MGDFSALHVALSGLRAAQMAMDTASHNVSNANTVGYTRQQVDLTSRYPRFTPNGQVGTGVRVSDVSRARDVFLDARFRSSASAASSIDARSVFLDRAELALAEPEMGVTAELSRLFQSFEDLSLNPPDEASRVGVISNLSALAGRINAVAANLDSLRADGVVTLESTVGEINSTLQRVAELNVSILDASTAPGQPNDLMDQRDRLLDRLAELAGTTVSVDDNGSVRVSIGGISLVSGAQARTLSYDRATGQVLHPSGIEVVPGGALRGYQLAVNDDVPNLMARLDAFTVDVVDAINSVHASGFTAAGTAGGDLLAYDPLAPALTLATAISHPDDLATAASAGPPYPMFDGAVAAELGALRSTPIGGTRSLLDSYRAFVTELGQESAAARTSAETQFGLASAAGLARDSSHGVSVDEEMVNLMEFQRMYEAAARVITIVDQALETVINRMGVVGR